MERAGPPILGSLGAILVFLLLNIEIADYFSIGPTLTFSFTGNFSRDMTYSIAWALFALALILVGMRIKQRAARYAGVALLGITLAKLFLHDLSDLDELYRIGAFVSVAVILIAASFIYQRFLAPEARLNDKKSRPEWRLALWRTGSHFLLSQIARRCSFLPMSPTEGKRVSTKATSIVGLAVLCSRVLGLIREMVIAALFGASRNMDAFLTAFRAPNMLRDLFAEGALSTAFVTTFSRRIATEGDQSAWGLANKVATLTLVFMSAMTLLGIVFAPLCHWNSRARLPCGKSRPHDSAHADHVSVHSPRLARRAGHGNAEREETFRRSGDGFEFF